MSVNVSPVRIDCPDFTATVTGALQRHGVPPQTLVVEITEGVAMTDTEAAAAVLNALRALGVHVALDDFGTGFSSLRSLQELPIDVNKIDRSFLVSAASDPNAASMLEAIVSLGHTLELGIVAEGIETPADVARLGHLGIAGQGFLFARPLCPTAAAEFRDNATKITVAATSTPA